MIQLSGKMLAYTQIPVGIIQNRERKEELKYMCLIIIYYLLLLL